jgi:hypothetical protein
MDWQTPDNWPGTLIGMTGSKDQQKEQRTRRLSLALRDNLKRRKAQARGRVADGASHDSVHGHRGRSTGTDLAGTSPNTHDSAEFAENNKRNS